MRSRSGHAGGAVALVAAAAALVWGAMVPGANADETMGATPTATTLTVSDATLDWEINDQTQARSHNPAAINFLSAGVADPGRGGAEVRPTQWRAAEGHVTIQKRDASGTWQTATWAGLGTSATGQPIATSGPYSGHRLHVTAGTGTLDPATDTARLEWQGTFSVVYYGGNSVFTATDPVLEVAGGTGTLTATLGGWDGDRNDPTVWTPATPQRVVVADLSGVDVTETGLLSVPTYAGVEVTGTVPQVRDEAGWGSFPPSMIAYLGPLGVDQFWYSTGLSTDSTKTPAPIVVGWGGSAPLVQPTSTATPTPTATATPSNTVKNPPQEPTRTTRPTPTAAAPTVPAAPDPLPTQVAVPPAEPASVAAPETVLAAQPAVHLTAATPVLAAAPAGAEADLEARAPWWIAGVLLLAAAVLLLLPARARARSPGQS